MKMEEDATYGKMQESLMEEARELSILCGVDVALLCAGGPGTGDGDGSGAVSTAEVAVWESEEGVLASYRAILPRPEAHTLRECLELKLARMGPSSPWCGSAAISACTCGMTRRALPTPSLCLSSAMYVGSSGGGGNQPQTTPAGDDINYSDDQSFSRNAAVAAAATTTHEPTAAVSPRRLSPSPPELALTSPTRPTASSPWTSVAASSSRRLLGAVLGRWVPARGRQPWPTSIRYIT
ncbi:hypothetical protein OsI_01762 [Oryza sativa Indica Group]|uniref:MADS-box domain-containing protein n=1 Tax=Oryza sativa subsp. indica TaxID=39946 RepID=A2WPI4_ORYSI|nr:hypothetical protein OsI_01762 [Oryza sativa Indica Group]